MDFPSDRLFEGRPYRILTIVDCHSRESLAIDPRGSSRAFHVVEVLERLTLECGVPKTIRCHKPLDWGAGRHQGPRPGTLHRESQVKQQGVLVTPCVRLQSDWEAAN